MIWRKIESSGIAILAGLLLLASLIWGWMMFVDGTLVNPPMVYDTKELMVDRSCYAPGDIVSVYLDVAKLRDVPGRITWQLIDGRMFPYATRELRYATGVYEKWISLDNEKLPTSNLIEDGVYHFEGTVEKDVNPLRTVVYKLKTVPFKIRKECQG